MSVHHQKHHAAYVTNLNVAEEKYHEASVKSDLKTQIGLQPMLRFNGGGMHTIVIYMKDISITGLYGG
jgi:Fe-Mn family superoxide dismutase